MAKNQTVYVRPAVLTADEEAYIAIMALTGYRSTKAACTQEALSACRETLRSTEAVMLRAEKALAAARDDFVQAQWDFHNTILYAKAQVLSQYGPDSNEVQSLGIKKKSEYKASKRSRTKAG